MLIDATKAARRLVLCHAVINVVVFANCGTSGPGIAGTSPNATAEKNAPSNSASTDMATIDAANDDTDASTASPPALAPPRTLALAHITSPELAQDDRRLYYAGPLAIEPNGDSDEPSGDLIWVVDKRDGEPLQLTKSPLGPIGGLAVEGGQIYFTVRGRLALSAHGNSSATSYRPGRVVRSNVTGGATRILFSKRREEPTHIVVSGEYVIWLGRDQDPGQHSTIRRMPVRGGKSRTLATCDTPPVEIVVYGEHVYWLAASDNSDEGENRAHIWRVGIDGGKSQEIGLIADAPSAIVVVDEFVFAAGMHRIVQLPITGGASTVLADGQSGPISLAVDQNNVYWTERGNGTVKKLPRGGGTIATLAADQIEPRGLALDERSLYWIVNDAIKRLDKPDAAPSPPKQPPAQPQTAQEFPEKWRRCSRHKQCKVVMTDCCRYTAVHKKFLKKGDWSSSFTVEVA